MNASTSARSTSVKEDPAVEDVFVACAVFGRAVDAAGCERGTRVADLGIAALEPLERVAHGFARIQTNGARCARPPRVTTPSLIVTPSAPCCTRPTNGKKAPRADLVAPKVLQVVA
jgi:hypothetical protein